MVKFVHQRKGFSLVEMLLTIMVVTGLLIVIFELLEDYVEKELAVATADYMENIALAVQDIVENPTYFQQAYALADARPSDTLELSLNDLVEGFGTIPGSTRLNQMVRERNPMGASISVLLRIADNPSDLSDVQAFDILVATNEQIIDERLRRAATAAGGHGGLIREGATTIRNAFASWEIPVNNFSGTAWAAAVTTTPATIEEGGYLAHYRHVSFEDIAGDYMFRVSVPGRPDLNRMYTNLDMGSNNIMGADNFALSNDMILEGQAIIDGDMSVTGLTQINQGDVYAGRRFKANSAGIRGVANGGVTGNFTVDDSINIGSINMGGQVNAVTATMRSGLDTSAQVDTTNIHMYGGISSVGDGIQTSNLHSNSGDTQILSMGRVSAASLNASTLTVSSGRVGAENIVATGAVNVSGSIVSPTVASDNLSVGTFGACDKGC